jgi:serine/threonine-protein kinase RsbW
MAELPNVRLDLPSRPENVMLVRELLAGVAEAIELDGSDLNDIRTAVTEACNNVVLHAYGGGEGPLEIEVYLTSDAFHVAVRDRGTGWRAPPEHDRGTGSARVKDVSSGIGIPVIRALVHRVEFDIAEDGGTEVRMEFATPITPALQQLQGARLLKAPSPYGESERTTALTIAPTHLARTILPRVLSVLAAQAHFSTDRISDTQVVADALVAHVGTSSEESYLNLAVDVAPRNLQLHIGPLNANSAGKLLTERIPVKPSLAELGSVIEKLTDHQHVSAVGSSKVLTLELVDRH